MKKINPLEEFEKEFNKLHNFFKNNAKTKVDSQKEDKESLFILMKKVKEKK
ncbi:MAG: hypothetical protein V3U80_06225 [Flavobacteriaceae bacterium]